LVPKFLRPCEVKLPIFPIRRQYRLKSDESFVPNVILDQVQTVADPEQRRRQTRCNFFAAKPVLLLLGDLSRTVILKQELVFDVLDEVIGFSKKTMGERINNLFCVLQYGGAKLVRIIPVG